MRLNELERALERVEGFSSPSSRLEQYQTPASLAARLLYHAFLRGDITARNVCDVGCGTGILSIGASLLGAAKVTGVENDHRALAVARKNAGKWDGYVVTDNSVVSRTLRQELLNRNISENGIDSITINSQGRFEIPFEASTNYEQIKDILYSIVDKSITSRKVNGFSRVKIPVTMWENSDRGRSLAIKLKDAKGKITGYRKITAAEYDGLSEEDKKDVALTDDTLKFYEDANGRRRIQVLIPNWLRKKIPPGKFKDDKELLRYLNSEEGGKILRGIGFRIPTQGLNSMDVIEIVGFLPDFMSREPRADESRLLETLVFLDLRRQRYEVDYLVTRAGRWTSRRRPPTASARSSRSRRASTPPRRGPARSRRSGRPWPSSPSAREQWSRSTRTRRSKTSRDASGSCPPGASGSATLYPVG